MIISEPENSKIDQKLMWQAMKLVWQKSKLVVNSTRAYSCTITHPGRSGTDRQVRNILTSTQI